MSLAFSLANNFLSLLDAMAMYILIGLFIAGLLKQIVPDDFIIKHLGKGNIISVVKATIFGIPLPVCSCSVIPLAQSLRKEGASKGAVQSFLISSPITGADSILATYSFFGFIFTIYRVVSSMLIAISVGIVQNFFDKKEEKETKEEESSCSCHCSCGSGKIKKVFSIKEVFFYAYVTLFKDMVKPLFIGLIFATLFTTLAPKEYTSLLFENQFLTYLIIILFSMPLYICATASLPIAAALIIEGMSPGAAFILLSAGPATSLITMSLVYKTLGKTSLIIYLTMIAFLSLIFGYIFDLFFSNINILNFSLEEENSSLISQTSSFIMLILMSYYLIKPWLNIKKKSSKCSLDDCH